MLRFLTSHLQFDPPTVSQAHKSYDTSKSLHPFSQLAEPRIQTEMASQGPLYIGFDLSTQQLKGLVVSSDLKVINIAKFDFDVDSKGFDVKKGVLTNEAEHEVFAPVAMWLQALDHVLQQLKDQGLDFSLVKGVSGAGQQHGSVYWNENAEKLLRNLDKERTLEEQLPAALSYPYSPNWQDASTQKECDEFDAYLGSQEKLAQVTGSKAHHVSEEEV